MNRIPTRWRTTFEEQLADAVRRIDTATAQLERGEGQRALQDAYPAVVAAATVRVWLEHPPWVRPLPASELQRKAKDAFPSLFSAMASLDMRDVLNSPWPADAVRPYLNEARTFVQGTREQLEACLAQG
jgi:hypothetical protein